MIFILTWSTCISTKRVHPLASWVLWGNKDYCFEPLINDLKLVKFWDASWDFTFGITVQLVEAFNYVILLDETAEFQVFYSQLPIKICCLLSRNFSCCFTSILDGLQHSNLLTCWHFKSIPNFLERKWFSHASLFLPPNSFWLNLAIYSCIRLFFFFPLFG